MVSSWLRAGAFILIVTITFVVVDIVFDPFCRFCPPIVGPVSFEVTATPQQPLVIGDGRVVFGARNETETRLAVYAPESAESAVLTFGTCKSFDEEFALTDTPIMLGPLEGNASTTFTITLETPSFLHAGERYSCTASVHDDAGDAIAYGAFILTS